jgi:hypothetical protein
LPNYSLADALRAKDHMELTKNVLLAAYLVKRAKEAEKEALKNHDAQTERRLPGMGD